MAPTAPAGCATRLSTARHGVGSATGVRSGVEVTVATTERSGVRLRDCGGGGRCDLPITFHLNWPGLPQGWHAAVELMRLREVSTFEMDLADACGPANGPFSSLLELGEAEKSSRVRIELELRARTQIHSIPQDARKEEPCARLWIRRRWPGMDLPEEQARVSFHLLVRAAPHGVLAADMPWVYRGSPLLDTKANGARVCFSLAGGGGMLESAVRAMRLGDSARLLLAAGAFAGGCAPDAAAPEQLRRLLASWQGPLEIQFLGLGLDGEAGDDGAACGRPLEVPSRETQLLQRDDCKRRVRQTFSEIQAVCQDANAHRKLGDRRSARVCYRRGFELARSLTGLEPLAARLPGGRALAAGLAKQREAVQLAMYSNLATCRFLQGDGASFEEVLEDVERELGLERGETAGYRAQTAAKLAATAPEARHAERREEARRVERREEPVLLSYSPGDEGLPLKFPSPLVAPGIAALDEAAARIASAVEVRGSAAYAEELLRETRAAVEAQFGSGASLKRLAPCVGMIARQEQLQGYEPGLGRRQMSSYIAGLEPKLPFHNTADYPWCASLAASTSAIMAELRAHEHMAELWTSGNRDAPEWRSIVLVKRGLWTAKHHFPNTKALFMSLRGVRPTEVCLAKMPPHTQIKPHSDNSNFMLTAHLALEVAGSCSLHVGEWTREWRTGQALVFDHSYIHSASNDSNSNRFVLVFRFFHPGCTDEESYALSYLAVLLESVLRQGRVAVLLEAEHRAG